MQEEVILTDGQRIKKVKRALIRFEEDSIGVLNLVF